MPLYYCLGKSIQDDKITKNKVKTGLITSGLVYFIFSVTVAGLAWPLIKLMGQKTDLQEGSVSYIQLEVFGIVTGSLAKFLMVIFVMRQWNNMLYATLFVQMIFSAVFDYGFASSFGLNLGAIGVAYSSIFTNVILLIVCFLITWIKLKFTLLDLTSEYSFNWLKNWSKVGFFSGLDSLIRNVVYLIAVLRAVNVLNEQGL